MPADKWDQYAAPADKWEKYAQPEPTPTPKPPTTAEQIRNFPQNHPYITAGASLLPGVGPVIGALTDPRGDVGRGALKQMGRDAYNITEGAGPLGMAAHYLSEKTGLGNKIRTLTEPNNPAQEVGGYGASAAEMAIPLTRAGEAIPNAERAGKAFQEVMSKAKDVPVDVSRFAQPALDARKLNKIAGDPYPPVLRKAFGHIQPSTDPLTYGDARTLAGAAGRKAVALSMQPQRLTGPMKMHAAQLAEGLDAANAEAAESVGMGQKYRDAMTEYRRAKALEDFGNTAKKVGVGAALTGGAYEGGKYALRKALGQ